MSATTLGTRLGGKKILIVSYHFPPDAAVGAIRPAEFARHLPYSGWEPVVLTVREGYADGLDRDRYGDLKCQVHRTSKSPSVNELYLAVRRLFISNNGTGRSHPRDKEWFASNAANGAREPLWSRVLRYYNSLVIYLPDHLRGWFRHAVWKGFRVVRRNNIDAVLTTSPPHSVQLIGLGLKLLTNKPWIVDFRDPWEVELKPLRSRTRVSEWIERRMEKIVVAHSSKVVSVTEAMSARLRELYPAQKDKFVTIPNGYDPGSLLPYLHTTKREVFTISYVGSLYFGRNPQTFLTAVSMLIRGGKIGRQDIKIRFIGDCRESDGKSVESMVERLGLDGVVEFVDAIPQRDALQEIARSHVLLLMAPRQPLQIPGKVYEYIGLRTKILSVCGEGATRDLMRKYSLARNVMPDDVDGMKEAILHFYARKADKSDAEHGFRFDMYERGNLAKDLSALLLKLTE